MPRRIVLDEAWTHGTRTLSPGQPGATGVAVAEDTWEVLLVDRTSGETIVYTMRRSGRDDLMDKLSHEPTIIVPDVLPRHL